MKQFKKLKTIAELDLPCDERTDINNSFEVAHQNGDANCFRERSGFSEQIVRKNQKICNDCVYNKTGLRIK